jgi:hypothetical protein
MPAIDHAQLDANDLRFLRKLCRQYMRTQRRRIAQAKPNATLDEYLATRRGNIAYAQTVVAKLGGDPELFMEPGLDGPATSGPSSSRTASRPVGPRSSARGPG